MLGFYTLEVACPVEFPTCIRLCTFLFDVATFQHQTRLANVGHWQIGGISVRHFQVNVVSEVSSCMLSLVKRDAVRDRPTIFAITFCSSC